MLTYFVSGVCDFEKNFCGFTQVQSDKFDWVRNQGKTPTSGTGPLVDHTLGSSLGKRQILNQLTPAGFQMSFKLQKEDFACS